MTNAKSNFAITIYFGETTEYMCWKNETSTLLENAIWYTTKEEAEAALEIAKEFGKASGWNVEFGIYEFEA